MLSGFFQKKRNLYWFFFQNDYQKGKNRLIKAKKYLNCNYPCIIFKNFCKLLFIKREKLWTKKYFYQSEPSSFLLKLKNSNLIKNRSSKKIHCTTVIYKTTKNISVLNRKIIVEFLNFFSWLFDEIQYFTGFASKPRTTIQMKNEHYLSVISIYKFLKKINKKLSKSYSIYFLNNLRSSIKMRLICKYFLIGEY